MSELSFTQPERRSFLVPALIAIAAIGIAAVFVYHYTTHHTLTFSITHVAVLPEHTVFKSDSKVVGHQDPFQDDLYVLATLSVDNTLTDPAYIKDITGTLTTADGTVTPTSAVEKNDFDNLYVAFPALKPLASAPLLRETLIQPGGHADGMIILHFPVTQDDWDHRKSSDVTLDFYHQDPITIPIPKP